MKQLGLAVFVTLVGLLFVGCPSPLADPPAVYSVTYDGNGSTAGQVPVDATQYEVGGTVTVLGNAGDLVRTGYAFTGWNTAPDGSGANYAPGATFTMDAADVTLYAQWASGYAVTYDGNGSTGGTVPIDDNIYESGAAVTVADVGSLVRTAFVFTGWNTAPDGSGTSYAPFFAFLMPSVDLTLYAQWDVDKVSASISMWDTATLSAGSSVANQVSLPLESTGTYDFLVNWGDAHEDRIRTWDDPALTHTYAASGIYEITLWGLIDGFRFADSGDKKKITDISRWGPLQLGNNGAYFQGAVNLTISA